MLLHWMVLLVVAAVSGLHIDKEEGGVWGNV